MNKRLFLLILILPVSMGLLAQVSFTGGLRGGVVTSQVSGDGLAGWNRFGYGAGAYVEMGFSDEHSVTMEMLYLTKGSRKPADPDNGDYNTFSMNFSYVEVPLTYNLKRGVFQFDLGAYAGVLLSSDIEFNGAEYPVEPPFNSTDIGITGGVHWLAGEHLTFNLRGSSSLLPIRPAPNPVQQFSYYEKGQYNQVLALLLGYRF